MPNQQRAFVGRVGATQDPLFEIGCQLNNGGFLVTLASNGLVRNTCACANTKIVGAACLLQPNYKVNALVVYAQTQDPASPLFLEAPGWRIIPTVEQVAAFYPREAQLRAISGEAILACKPTPTGLMEHCFVFEESPADVGFGEAAVRLASYFQLKPMPSGASIPENARVKIPIRFVIVH